jgi:hypothetical protein
MSKIFCIGDNKTGTTSLTSALLMLGYKICPEKIMYNFGSNHFKNFQEEKFDEFFELIDQYEVFEDRPWNHTEFYKVLHETYPDAKFIFTTRNVDDWWNSYERWNKLINLKNAWFYKLISQISYGVDSFFDHPDLVKQIFLTRNAGIRNYFHDNPRFLEIDIVEEDKFNKLCKFLEKEYLNQSFPHLNKTNG